MTGPQTSGQTSADTNGVRRRRTPFACDLPLVASERRPPATMNYCCVVGCSPSPSATVAGACSVAGGVTEP